MAKLVTKFKYMHGGSAPSVGNYAKYIATREGVEKIDDTKKNLPATIKQKDFIEKLIKDFPDSKESLEYEDYISDKTIVNACEYIERTLEDNSSFVTDKTYADYIATRPRVEKLGSHGLFSDDGKPIILSDVSRELNEHKGNIWTAIISLRREDAQRLSFDNASAWRDMLRSEADTLAKNMKIDKENFHWYAAFHNEGHHPHVHLIMYSDLENEGYLTPKGIYNIRSSIANDIFSDELLSIYKEQTEQRNKTKELSEEYIQNLIGNINNSTYTNTEIEKLLLELHSRLEKTSGKKVYGYLKADVKNIVDEIIKLLEENESIKALYDAWYDKTEDVHRIYNSAVPKRVSLVDNKEFKSIKNMIIRETMNIYTLTDDEDDIPDDEPTPDDSEYDMLLEKANQGNKVAQYRLAKMLLDIHSPYYDKSEAVYWLEKSAKLGNDFAKYRLGKIFLYDDEYKNFQKAYDCFLNANSNSYAQYQLGKMYLYGAGVEKDASLAEYYFTLSAENGNKYAEAVLENMKRNENYFAAITAMRLFESLAKLFKSRLNTERQQKTQQTTDRKMRRKINEKKQAQGLKISM